MPNENTQSNYTLTKLIRTVMFSNLCNLQK